MNGVGKSDLGTFAYVQLHPMEADLIFGTFVLTGVVASCSMIWQAPGLAAKAFFVISYVFAVAKLLEYLASPHSLVERLKNAKANPYGHFLVLAAGLYLCLTISIASLTHGPRHIQLDDLSILFDDVLSVTKIKAVISGANSSGVDNMRLIACLLFGVTVLDVIRKFKEFRREDKHYIAMAWANTSIGRFARALELLEQARLQSPARLSAEALAYFGVGQIDRAVELVEQASKLEGDAEIKDPAMLLLAASAHTPVAPRFWKKLLTKWVATHPADSTLFSIISYGLACKRLTTDEAENAVNVVAPGDIPLTTAMVRFNQRRFDEALKVLQAFTATEPFDIVVQQFVILLSSISGDSTMEEDRMFFERWADQWLNTILEKSAELKFDYQRVSVFGMLRNLYVMARGFESQVMEQIEYVSNRVQASITKKSPLVSSFVGVITMQTNSRAQGLADMATTMRLPPFDEKLLLPMTNNAPAAMSADGAVIDGTLIEGPVPGQNGGRAPDGPPSFGSTTGNPTTDV